MLIQDVLILGRIRRAFKREIKREAVELEAESEYPTAQLHEISIVLRICHGV